VAKVQPGAAHRGRELGDRSSLRPELPAFPPVHRGQRRREGSPARTGPRGRLGPATGAPPRSRRKGSGRGPGTPGALGRAGCRPWICRPPGWVFVGNPAQTRSTRRRGDSRSVLAVGRGSRWGFIPAQRLTSTQRRHIADLGRWPEVTGRSARPGHPVRHESTLRAARKTGQERLHRHREGGGAALALTLFDAGGEAGLPGSVQRPAGGVKTGGTGRRSGPSWWGRRLLSIGFADAAHPPVEQLPTGKPTRPLTADGLCRAGPTAADLADVHRNWGDVLAVVVELRRLPLPVRGSRGAGHPSPRLAGRPPRPPRCTKRPGGPGPPRRSAKLGRRGAGWNAMNRPAWPLTRNWARPPGAAHTDFT